MEKKEKNLKPEITRDLIVAMAFPIAIPAIILVLSGDRLKLWPHLSLPIFLTAIKVSSILGLAQHATRVQKIIPKVPRRTRMFYGWTPIYMVVISLFLVLRYVPCYVVEFASDWSTSCNVTKSWLFFYVVAIASFFYMVLFALGNRAAMNKRSKWDDEVHVTETDRKKAKKFGEFFLYMVNIPTIVALVAILTVRGIVELVHRMTDEWERGFEAAVVFITFVATPVAICVDVYARHRMDETTAPEGCAPQPKNGRIDRPVVGLALMFLSAAICVGALKPAPSEGSSSADSANDAASEETQVATARGRQRGAMTYKIPTVVLAAACIALNVAVGTLVYLLKLPLYLDSAGIMLAALLVPGSRLQACVSSSLVAIISFVAIGLLVSPYEPWFIGTGIAGGIYGSLVVRGRVDDLVSGTASLVRFLGKLIFFGVGWGIVAAIVSAPVIVWLFGGVTGAGTTLILAFFVKTGHQLLTATLLSGFSAEPIDKTLSLFLAIIIARFTPQAFLKLLRSDANGGG